MSDNQPLSGDIEWLLNEGQDKLYHELAEIAGKYLCRPGERETLRPLLEEYVTQYNRFAAEKNYSTIPMDRVPLFAKDISAHFFENRNR